MKSFLGASTNLGVRGIFQSIGAGLVSLFSDTLSEPYLGLQTTARIPALDTLRGLAILLVVASHAIPLNSPFYILSSPIGGAGVLLFFLLSGYLIFRNLERQSVSVFLTRRAFKLFPAYWLSLVLIALAGYPIAEHHFYSPWDYAANALMMDDLGGHNYVSGVYWTLAVELKFYLLIAAQRRFIPDAVWSVPIAAIILNVVYFLASGHMSATLAFIPVFYVGIAVYKAKQSGWDSVKPVAIVLVLVFIELAFLEWKYTIALLLVTAIFLVVVRRQQSVLWLGFLGWISYSLYLFHLAIMNLFAWSFYDGWIPLIAGSIVSIGIAWVSFRWIEEPSVRFGRNHEHG